MPQRTDPASKQFSDPRLVAVYDSVNALGDDRSFWCTEIERLAPATLIDLGCGTGLLTCELARRGYLVIGIDPAAAMLETAKQKPFADQVRWIEGGYEQLAGLQADLLLMTSHVAQFLLEDGEWNAALKAAYRALTVDGHILFDSRRSLAESFERWPTANAPRRVVDPVAGEIAYWCKLLGVRDKRARYQLHYRFGRTGDVIVSTDEIIFRSYDEIVLSLSNAGFSIKSVYGDWKGNAFDPRASPEMIFVARRL